VFAFLAGGLQTWASLNETKLPLTIEWLDPLWANTSISMDLVM
jgi:hypothetical protein